MRAGTDSQLLRILTATGLLLMLLAAPALASEEPSVTITSVELSRYPEAGVILQVGGSASVKSAELNADTFAVAVDGHPIEGVQVEPTDSQAAPNATVLLIDESGSMKGEPIRAAAQAGKRFVEAMRTTDVVALQGFDEEFRVLQDLTGDKQALSSALETLVPRGETGLYDAVIRSLETLKSAEEAEDGTNLSRYLIVLSDGGDTASSNTLEQALAHARASDVQIYTVGLMGNEFDATPLVQLAEATGGRYLEAPGTDALSELYATLARELHTAYLLTFQMPEAEGRQAGQLSVQMTYGEQSAEAVRGFFYPPPPPTTPAAEEGREPAPILETTSAKPLPGFLKSFAGWEGSPYSIAIAIFALVFVAGYALSGVLFPRRNVLAEYSDILSNRRKLAPRPEGNEAARRPGERAIGRLLQARGYHGPLQQRIEDAGWKLRTSEFVLFHVSGVALVACGFWVAGSPALLTIAALGLATAGPLVDLESRARNRKKQFEEQVPDVLVLLANSLRAGQGFEQALQVVAGEGPDPSASEFRRLLAQQRLGVTPEEALRTLAERMQSQAFDWVVMATVIQRQVGGNLAEIYDSIANTLRERESLKREVATLTAEGKLSAIILIALPIVVGFFIQVLNPDYMSVMFTTQMGFVLLGATALAMLAGVFWIRKIVTFKV